MLQNKSLRALIIILLAGWGIHWLAQRSPPGEAPVPATADDAVIRLLSRALLDPQGKAAALSQWQGKPVLINFWASWCAPCREEMPRLNRFSMQQGTHGIQVLGIAWDQTENVQQYLRDNPTTYPNLLADDVTTGLLPDLGDFQKALPFSILIDGKGHVRHIKLGALKPEELDKWPAHSEANGSQMK